MKTTQEMIEVMQAYVDGKQIEILYSENWEDNSVPLWNWWNNDYRIKPKAKVKRWLFAYDNPHSNCPGVSIGHYSDEVGASNAVGVHVSQVQKLEFTIKEFDE